MASPKKLTPAKPAKAARERSLRAQAKRGLAALKLHVAKKKPAEVICIGTSATVQETESTLDASTATRHFTARLFGVPAESVELVTEPDTALGIRSLLADQQQGQVT